MKFKFIQCTEVYLLVCPSKKYLIGFILCYRYNQSHIKTRNVVERQYGVWKRRFACLSQELRCKVSNSMKIIVATAVLHNIARSLGDFEDENILTDDDIPYDSIQADFTGGMAKRSALVAEFF